MEGCTFLLFLLFLLLIKRLRGALLLLLLPLQDACSAAQGVDAQEQVNEELSEVNCFRV